MRVLCPVADCGEATRLPPDAGDGERAAGMNVATARELGATLVTRDREMIAYGEKGNVSVLAC